MLYVSKHEVENNISFFMQRMGVRKSNKRIRVSCCSASSQNNMDNEQHKHQVKIYTVLILSLRLIPLFVL